MKMLLSLALAVMVSASTAYAQLYAAPSDEGSGPDVGNLLVLDRANGDIIERIPLSFSGGGSLVDMQLGMVGIAVNPTSGTVYVILNESPRSLATVDPATGIVTRIGDIGDFCGVTFGNDGTLFAIASQDNSDPGAVHTVNLATAVTTLFRASADTLPGGFPSGGGQSIEFNPVDGQLYFANENGVFMRMDLATKTATAIPLVDDPSSQSVAYEVESGTFLLWFDDTDEFFRLDPTTGTAVVEGTGTSEDNQLRGFAFVRSAAVQSAPLLGQLWTAALFVALSLIACRRISRTV